jgi:transcription initiation factor TFIIIB Brf1 subunit/transcription initiation factor TFIIB
LCSLHVCDPYDLIQRECSSLPLPTGDYWPGEAENLLNTIMEENRIAGKRGSGAAGAPIPRLGR